MRHYVRASVHPRDETKTPHDHEALDRNSEENLERGLEVIMNVKVQTQGKIHCEVQGAVYLTTKSFQFPFRN